MTSIDDRHQFLAGKLREFYAAHPDSTEILEAANALSAIASRQAVVPLEWRPNKNYSIAKTPFGEYTVTRYEESDGIGWEAVYQDAEVIGTFPTEADARNACDALHAQRINSALAAPVRDETEIRAAALEEAAKVVENMPLQIYRDAGIGPAGRSCKEATFYDAAAAIRALSQTLEGETR